MVEVRSGFILLSFCLPMSSLLMRLKFATMFSSEPPLSLLSEERQGRTPLVRLLTFPLFSSGFCRLVPPVSKEGFLSKPVLLVLEFSSRSGINPRAQNSFVALCGG
jgi:hypothetical protein